MPELPEVETVVRQLCRSVIGRMVQSFTSRDKLVVHQSMKKLVPGIINAVERKGKYILLSIGNQQVLAHLRMTGHFSLDKKGGKYLAGTFHFTDGGCLNFHDIRRFGVLKLVSDVSKELGKIGPDPLEMDGSAFVKRLQLYPRAVVKNKLLDQSCVSGIGNIYAQEALFHAGIAPQRKVGDLALAKVVRLHDELQRVLRLAIENNGTTKYNYSHLDGKGSFQDLLAVYQREKCPQGHRLKREVIGGRGTWWCKRCQK